MADQIQEEKVAAFTNPLPGVPDAESPFFDDVFRGREDDRWYPAAKALHDDGFAVIDFPDERLGERIDAIIDRLDGGFDWESWRQGNPAGGAMRIQDAWKDCEDVREIAVNREILELLEYCYGRRTIPFQTLNFPVGTQQHFHSDSLHFSSIPERFMVGVWVAFEDTDADNGPLIYYPGSHKLPCFGNEHFGVDWTGGSKGQMPYHDAWEALVEAHGLQPMEFHAKKGQALIWSANLLHGGKSMVAHERTRWSQVTHYYFENCVYYTPMYSDLAFGRGCIRSPVNILTGKKVENMYLGQEVNRNFIGILRSNYQRGLEGKPPMAEAKGGAKAAREPGIAGRIKRRIKARMRRVMGRQ